MKLEPSSLKTAVVFSVMRALKRVNKGDTYLENYYWHLAKNKEKFYDTYMFAWDWGVEHHPKRILEVGVRTGISICQLLSSYLYYDKLERVLLIDIFNDGFCSPELVKLNLHALNIPLDKIEFKVGNSHQILPDLKHECFDYILVDGDHDKKGALCDLYDVTPLCVPGGVIVFDDIAKDGCALDDVWQEWKKDHTEKFDFYENYDGKGLGVAVCR